MKKITIALGSLILCLLVITAPGSAFSDGINWQSYDKGLAMAKAQNKKIFLYFHADWCHYCKKMKKTTFKNADLINYLNKHFISIMVNVDKEKKIARFYRVRGLPTLWFLKDDSTKLSRIPGFVQAHTLVNVLKYINTENYIKMSFKDFLKTI